MKISTGLYGELSPYLDDEDDLIYFPDDELENGHSWREDVDKYFKNLNIPCRFIIEDFIEQPNISWYTCSFPWVEKDGIHIENYRLKLI